ncbi:MAG: 2-polyprenylphenol 6-hydroxylase [Rickettsiales bacterium]|nr:2-polyprenylphenol 6-hydroxylase [Rickettsiales bacterium]
MPKDLKNSLAILRIGYVFAKHDALFVFDHIRAFPAATWISRRLFRQAQDLPAGKRLAAAFRELGPTFIKLGQTLSTRSDLIGDDIARDLAELQDRVPPFDSALAKQRVEESLGAPISALYSQFDEHPIAAASIAQVHFATTTEGRAVAVKILRPGIAEAFARDLELFQWIADTIERRIPNLRRLRPREMVETVRNSVYFELDLRYEAASAVELKQNMASEPRFYVPEIDWNRTSDSVLTLERIDGIPINDITALKAAGHNLNIILEVCAAAFFNQVFRDGFFHADMHPGNVFIMADGRVAAIDFGIMGRLDWPNRVFLARVLQGFMVEDYAMVARVHFEHGIVPRNKSMEQFALACRAIAKPILGKPLNEISIAKLLGQLFKVSQDFEMRLQPQFLLLQKSMMVTEGVGRALNPDINTWKMTEPLIASWYRKNLGVQASARYHIREALDQLHRLPRLIETAGRVLSRMEEEPDGLYQQTLAPLPDRAISTSSLPRLFVLLVVTIAMLLVAWHLSDRIGALPLV